MNFIINLPILTNWKKNRYDSILVIIDQLIKMVYYKLIKVIINALSLVKIIIDVVIRHYGIFDLIIIDWRLLFNSKFWSLQCLFLDIK